MKTRSQKTSNICCHADKSVPRLTVTKQAGAKNYGAGTNSSPEHPSIHQKREDSNLGLFQFTITWEKVKTRKNELDA